MAGRILPQFSKEFLVLFQLLMMLLYCLPIILVVLWNGGRSGTVGLYGKSRRVRDLGYGTTSTIVVRLGLGGLTTPILGVVVTL